MFEKCVSRVGGRGSGASGWARERGTGPQGEGGAQDAPLRKGPSHPEGGGRNRSARFGKGVKMCGFQLVGCRCVCVCVIFFLELLFTGTQKKFSCLPAAWPDELSNVLESSF